MGVYICEDDNESRTGVVQPSKCAPVKEHPLVTKSGSGYEGRYSLSTNVSLRDDENTLLVYGYVGNMEKSPDNIMIIDSKIKNVEPVALQVAQRCNSNCNSNWAKRTPRPLTWRFLCLLILRPDRMDNTPLPATNLRPAPCTDRIDSKRVHCLQNSPPTLPCRSTPHL